MFIKVTSEIDGDKLFINTEHIIAVETFEGAGCIALSNNIQIKTTETFDQIVTMLRTQGLFVV